jgi:hypothetical protein
MGCFYVGYDYTRRKNGVLKIGETKHDTPARRLQHIRKNEAFECLGYLVIKANKIERLFIESYVRLMLARENQELTHQGNDHFIYTIIKGFKKEQSTRYAENALMYAEQACRFIQIEYKREYKRYKKTKL